jgi:8-amino-7-oxononanoate synthase
VDLIEMLIQRSRSYIYTTASPPALAWPLMKSLELIEAESWRRRRLEALEKRLASAPRPQCWQWARSQTPIQPLIIGGNREAVAVSDALAREGILVPAIRPPTVPAGTARLRISLSAAHTEEDVDRLVDALRWAEQASP